MTFFTRFCIVAAGFVLFSTGLVLGVGQRTDSLKELLGSTHNIEQKIDLMNRIADQFLSSAPDSSFDYAKRAIALSRHSKSNRYVDHSYALIGDILVMKDNLGLAEKYYDTALMLFEDHNDVLNMTGVLTVLGNINAITENTSASLQYYLRALDISLEKQIVGRLPYLYLNIGSNYYSAGHIQEAQDYYSKALDGFRQAGDSLNAARVLGSFGTTYLKIKEYDLAEKYLTEASVIFKALGSQADIAENLLDMSEIEELQGNPDEAIRLLEQALESAGRIGYEYMGPRANILAKIRVKLGRIYLSTGKLSKSKQNLLKAIVLSENNNFVSQQSEAFLTLSKLYEITGRLDSALYYHKRHKQASEEAINKENIKKMATIRAKHEFDQMRKDEKLKQDKLMTSQRRSRIYLLVAIVILILSVVVLILLLRLGKIRVERVELQHKNLQGELELRNREITTHVMSQLKKNEYIVEISSKLQKTLEKATPENKPVIERIIRDLESDNLKEAWKEFEVRFRNVHSDFYKNLLSDFPDLTSNELRLAAFLKLNLNSKEIASITGQSVNSIDVARSRLRQKLGLVKEENLNAYLAMR